MIVRSSRFLLVFLAATLLGAALFAVVAVWKLSQGPVRLGFLTPYIEDSLSGGPNDRQVRLHDTVITWAGIERTLDLRAVGLEILDRNGEVAASIPELSVQFSLRALMRGLVAPTGLELFGPRLRVVRQPDGEVVIGIGEVSGGRRSDRGGIDLLAGLIQEPDPGSPTGYLRQVKIVSALIEFEDLDSGRNWTAQRADIVLERDNNGIRADGTIVLDAGGNFARFEVSGLLDRSSKAIELGITFANLAPAILASLDPRLGELGRLQLPMSGTIALSLAMPLAIKSINFDLVGGTGEIAMPELYSAPLPITGLTLRGRAGDAFSSLVVDAATLDLGGPTVAFSGRAERGAATTELALEANAAAVSAKDLARLWPPEVGANARAWITRNITAGIVDAAKISLSGRASGANFETFELDDAVGEFDLRGATVHYLRPMRPLQNVAGVGRFDGVDLAIDVKQGGIGPLKIDGGTVAIRGLTGSAKVETAHIEGTISGPIRDALILLDEPPLQFISPLGIDPAQTAGAQVTKIVLDFPLLDALAVEDVGVAASARVENLDAPGAAFGSDLTQGNFTLAVDAQKMVTQGDARLSDIPVQLEWTERFTDETALRTQYEVQAVLDDAARRTLGIDVGDVLGGPVGVGLTYEVGIDGTIKGGASLNLTDATMAVRDFGWQKVAGQSGSAKILFAGRDDAITEISSIQITAPELAVEGRARFAPGGAGFSLAEVALSRLVLADTVVTLHVAFPSGVPPEVTIGGDQLDARAIVRDIFSEGDGDGKPPAMQLRFDAANPLRGIRLGEETVLLNPVGRLIHDGTDLADIDLTGALTGGGQVSLQLHAGNEVQNLLFQSDDGGAVLRALDWVTTIEGGLLSVNATMAGGGLGGKINGQAELADFKLNESSVGVRILSLASLSGISDAVAGSGITMRRAVIPFEAADDAIKIREARATGAGVGIIANGQIDLTTERVDLKGEIAPANVINSVLGNIPLVKNLIGDGIIAVAYSVKGPLEDPAISVNPLTVFVPGIFRKAFTGFGAGGGVDEGSTLPPAPPPPGE